LTASITFSPSAARCRTQTIATSSPPPSRREAHVIVTDNLKHFPDTALTPFGIEARSPDVFIADTAMLDISRAVAAVQKMRLRLGNPPISVDDLFIKMEAQGLTETVDALEPYAHLL
jgi:hypothetical protein